MFKSNVGICTSEKDAVFLWCRQDQKGAGGVDIHTITIWRKWYVGAPY